METAEYVHAETGIRLAQARYCDAVFRKDFSAFGNCLTVDSEWRVGGRVLCGRSECVAFLEDRLARLRWVLMTFRTSILKIAAQTASGRTYVTEQSALMTGGGRNSVATYFERFVREDGVWRRSWALFQLHYLGETDLPGRFFAQPDYGSPPAMPPDEEASAASA